MFSRTFRVHFSLNNENKQILHLLRGEKDGLNNICASDTYMVKMLNARIGILQEVLSSSIPIRFLSKNLSKPPTA